MMPGDKQTFFAMWERVEKLTGGGLPEHTE
jgi:hypothetical protein